MVNICNIYVIINVVNRARNFYIFWSLTLEMHWNGVADEPVNSDRVDLKSFLLGKRKHRARSVSLSSTSTAVLPLHFVS